ncbi:hypothetical protein NDU88_005292 [Pleurodeles waltl]|uniref:Uncharacterized protein n=1 Tax=Pleurodeles waltl TaxID=8319 RepID=A0AAV7UJG7_PLEWA|nr:hypothetical protein NDU88_005292 [Pleurodeles waltl]
MPVYLLSDGPFAVPGAVSFKKEACVQSSQASVSTGKDLPHRSASYGWGGKHVLKARSLDRLLLRKLSQELDVLLLWEPCLLRVTPKRASGSFRVAG